MKKVYPVGLSALLFLSGCSSFMGGRFAGVGERFASMRHRDGSYVVAEHVHTVTTPVQQLPATDMAVDSETVTGRRKMLPPAVHVEKGKGDRLLPEPMKPLPLRTACLPSPKHDGKISDAPGLIPHELATDAAEDSSVETLPQGTHSKEGGETIPLQYLRNRRLRLDYEVHGAGPSGVAAVELWYTRDGREWTKADALTQHPPYLVDFGEEGRFGITLVARNGLGVSQATPAKGDKPQAWVEIDFTKPDVIMSDVKYNSTSRVMSIAWSASDRNLDPRSVCLSYATEPDGPWTPIARNVDNLGKYDWKVDMSEGQRFYVRVEVMDLAGNIGSARTTEPLVLDTARPTAMITKLEEAP